MNQYIYPKNFPRAELLASETAHRKNIDNTPPSKIIEQNLVKLAYWLQDLRNRLSKHYKREVYITVTSGYRIEELNVAIGGSKRSAHVYGFAADIKASGLTTKELTLFIYEHCQDMPFDQCIDEWDTWVHVGIERPVTGERRGQFLTPYRNSEGKVKYKTPDYIEALTA